MTSFQVQIYRQIWSNQIHLIKYLQTWNRYKQSLVPCVQFSFYFQFHEIPNLPFFRPLFFFSELILSENYLKLSITQKIGFRTAQICVLYVDRYLYVSAGADPTLSLLTLGATSQRKLNLSNQQWRCSSKGASAGEDFFFKKNFECFFL